MPLEPAFEHSYEDANYLICVVLGKGMVLELEYPVTLKLASLPGI